MLNTFDEKLSLEYIVHEVFLQLLRCASRASCSLELRTYLFHHVSIRLELDSRVLELLRVLGLKLFHGINTTLRVFWASIGHEDEDNGGRLDVVGRYLGNIVEGRVELSPPTTVDRGIGVDLVGIHVLILYGEFIIKLKESDLSFVGLFVFLLNHFDYLFIGLVQSNLPLATHRTWLIGCDYVVSSILELFNLLHLSHPNWHKFQVVKLAVDWSQTHPQTFKFLLLREITQAVREVPAAKCLVFPESDELLPRHGTSIEENIIL